jgi:hypothetical protein
MLMTNGDDPKEIDDSNNDNITIMSFSLHHDETQRMP